MCDFDTIINIILIKSIINRYVMGIVVSLPSSPEPEPEDASTISERLLLTLAQKPLRMTNMLHMIRYFN